jgi:hypothetical protein
MLKRRPLAVLATFVVAFAVAPAALAASCARNDYTYAGFDSAWRAHGVGARITAVARPQVVSGHVAGWVGLGGPGLGPDGGDEWIQVGLSADDWSGETSTIYYEVTTPWAGPKYFPVAQVRPGISHRLAVLEMAHRRSWWRVWMDGHPVSTPIHLPGSHGSWWPQATAESWNGGNRGVCNRYAYRFDNVVIARGPGGAWQRLRRGVPFQDRGYRLSGGPTRFLAASS